MRRLEFEEAVAELLGVDSIDQMIRSQINKFITELQYDYQIIYRALYFFIKVENGKYDPKYGIGIVPYVVKRSNAYFAKLEEDKKKQVESVKISNKEPDVILKPEKIQKKKKIKLIDIEGIDVD